MREMDQMMNNMMDPFGMFNRHSMFGGKSVSCRRICSSLLFN